MSSKVENAEVKLKFLFDNLQKIGFSFQDLIDLSTKPLEQEKISIPIEALKNRNLGMLESIVIYLKDKIGLKFSEIARLLERNDRTIWTTYKKAKEKQKHDD